MKTLQQQYLLIKEGKGNKDYFLKQARNLFPEYITVNSDYKTAVHVLKSKSILSEGIGGIVTMNPNSKPDWFKIFDTNLKEAVGVKNTKEYGNQNEFDKIYTEVQKTLDNANFNYKDEKNIDNVYGQSFLMGYYTEMKDPKNAEKTVDELKDIVLKNMVKDVTYYNTKASFGVKDIGYTKDVVGGGDPVASKGKYKSSGYGDMPKAKTVKEGLNEAKKATIQTRIKDLEKQNEVLALESKITALEEAINELTQKVSLSESDDLAEMMDPKKINELKKDIKILEKYKMTCEKKLSKLGGKKEIVDEVVTGENPYFDTDPSDGDADEEDNMRYGAENYYDKGKKAFDEGNLEKAQEYYKQALEFGSYLGWTERELPSYETLNN
jgi:tetratricopeptide (TPR) repeat protein